jgi:putative tryptophan/tyrosine transport system substrate-binding protein
MKRREFITLLGWAAAWPLAARGQQPTMPVIGFLQAGVPETSAATIAAFRKGLSDAGFVEGRNVSIEYRWANNEFDRLPGLAAELVRLRVAVIAAPAGTVAALAAKAATTTIPIVFGVAVDPVQTGLVASLTRLGGNITGVSSMTGEIGTKRLALMHELLPRATRIGVLVNPSSPLMDIMVGDLQPAAAAIGNQIEVLTAVNNRDIDQVFGSLAQKRIDALLITSNALFTNRRVQIVTLASRHAMPVIYSERDSVDIGGLMSYGSSGSDRDRMTGIYTGRILKGEKPADLPVMRAVKFEFVINLQTARTLALDLPPGLLAIADEVIE